MRDSGVLIVLRLPTLAHSAKQLATCPYDLMWISGRCVFAWVAVDELCSSVTGRNLFTTTPSASDGPLTPIAQWSILDAPILIRHSRSSTKSHLKRTAMTRKESTDIMLSHLADAESGDIHTTKSMRNHSKTLRPPWILDELKARLLYILIYITEKRYFTNRTGTNI